ncbi:phosphodiesterase 4D interacting protein centrosomin isoform 2-T2 [Cochliomyia hominivorax]
MSSLNTSANLARGAGAENADESQKDLSLDTKRMGSPSFVEYELIYNMTSFLEANGAEDVDKKVLRNMAVALTKHLNDTSPGTLQDVTMENPYGVGYRSPCVSLQPYQGSTSPAAHGRSVREFEEQMATLRKENFNLKLRLYFIEESIPGYKQPNNTSSEDTLMKQLIDTKVEMEILRKEVQEKQDLLKDAAQAMTQMEKIQKEAEMKYQQVVEELNQKIQYLEMEREMEKSRNGMNGEFNELLERSDIAENVNALQKIHELEGLLKQSDDKLMDFQQQIYSLEELLMKRDETIKEYEEKVKELVFQNAELLETIENNDKEIANNERSIRGLRSKNTDLKADIEKLMVAIEQTQDNFRKEMSNTQMYERQMRDQQDVLSKMQSTISLKTENTARLLERLQDYEKMVTKMNIERNMIKRENRFFRTIINKLQNQTNCNECYTIEKEEIYRKFEHHNNEAQELTQDHSSKQDYGNQRMSRPKEKARHFPDKPTSASYNLKQKVCVNICQNGENKTSSCCDTCRRDFRGKSTTTQDLLAFNCIRDLASTECVDDYLQNYYMDFDNYQFQREIPIRYTFSDNSLSFQPNEGNSNENLEKLNESCTSLTPTFSSRLLCCHNDNLEAEFILQAQQLRDELHKLKMDVADKCCTIQDLEEKLKNRDQLYDKARLTIQKLMLNIKNQQIENSRLKNTTQTSNVSNNNEKEQHAVTGVSGLECTGFCRSFSDTEALNDLTSLQKQKYDNIIEQQETTIKNLKAEVKKKTADLQNLVNKELWEKNREIERLNKILNKSTSSPMSPLTQHNTSQADANGELQQSFSDVEYTKALQRNKLLQRKVDILIQRLGTERQNDALIAQLKTELKQARSDAETAEKWRRQCADLCATLSTRLEELAGFLNSLLKHKDVLGVLAVEKRKAMRRAVDRSLDLSKSLNMTLSVSGLSMIDQSLAELHNLSDILGDMDLDLENKTFNSHEDMRVLSIETLKAENKALKKELDKRRNADSKKERRSLPLPMMAENRESESEAWSEPDRKVSLARIGLEDHSSSLMAKEQPLPAAHNETDSDYSDSNGRSFKARSQERIAQLEQQIQQRDNRILEIQCQLVDADNRLKKENLKVLEVTQELEQLKQRNEELHNDLIAIGSQEPSNVHNESLLLKQIDEKSRSVEKLQEERERLLVESRLAEIQINSLKADMEIVKQTYEEALQQAAEKEKQQLTALKQELEQTMQQSLMAKEQEYQEYIERDFIAKNLYDECVQQLSELQKQYIEAQRNIECLQENEQELKQTLVETEITSRNLQKQIDESTLRASKAAMERVKALNDKLQLEKRVEELTQELNNHEQERQVMQQQIAHLEQEQQSLLERLTALQTKQQTISKNEENACNSGYTSEEVAMMPHASVNGNQNIVVQQRLGEQRIQNSSPDLGIESDAGRVSSVELNSVQRPLLKTVEMSPSSKHSSNESDDKEGLHDSSTENIKPSNVPDANAASTNLQQLAKKHDCLKVEQENAELRRKLLRTKRAFEDTYEKLRNANQRKAQIEKDIKNQILKTHNVLKNVRSNMENEL